MSQVRTQFALAGSSILFIVALALGAHAAAAPPAPPDSTLYTSYYFGAGYQNVSWIVCGSTQLTEGCYDSGTLGPFGQAGALIEGNPSVNTITNTVTRYIYIVDSAAGGGTGVTLYVYKKTDVVTSSFDTTTVTLFKTVSLPLTGGATATTSMAANNGFLFIGTNQSPFAYRVQKSNLSIVQVGGFSPPINVSSITSDKYGFVTVTFGGSVINDFNGNYQFGPNGESVGDGGGAWFMLNTSVALSTGTLPPTTNAFPAERLVVRPKKPAQNAP